MKNRTTRLIASLTLVACGSTVVGTPASAKPRGAPIAVEHDAPRDLKTGEEVNITLGFRALADLDRLDVEIIATSGLVIGAGPQKATFSAVQRMTAPTVVVRVRLTDSKFGTLGLTFRTHIGDRQELGAEVVICGDPRM